VENHELLHAAARYFLAMSARSGAQYKETRISADDLAMQSPDSSSDPLIRAIRGRSFKSNYSDKTMTRAVTNATASRLRRRLSIGP
jgi:hypothetical protein